jgi:hypothetical protein
MGHPLHRLVLALISAVAMAGSADAARYIQVNFETGLAPYYGSGGPSDPTVSYYSLAWRGEALIDTEAYPPYETNYLFDRPIGFTILNYTDRAIEIMELPTPDGQAFSATFTPVDLTSPSFSADLIRGTFTDVFIIEPRYGLTDTTSGRLRSLTLVGFDSPDPLETYVQWTVSRFVPSAAPEPASWMTMVGGFGAVGAAVRRRHERQARIA